MTAIGGRYEYRGLEPALFEGRVVLRARDTLLDCDVAVKGVFGAPLEPAVQALEAEYERLVRYAHPGLVQALELRWHIPPEALPRSGARGIRGSLASPSFSEKLAIRPFRFFTQVWLEAPSLASLAPLEPSEVRQWLIEALSVVHWLHQAGLTRLDLKADHFLQNAEGWRLIDLDQATLESWRMQSTVHGTLGYQAPEVQEGAPGSPASDMFSLGASACLALTGALPADCVSSGRGQAAPATPAGKYPLLSESLPSDPGLLHVVTACLSPIPSERPSAREALRMLEAGSRLREVHPPPARLVGRRAAWARATALTCLADEHQGGEICLIGPPLSGKSRFMLELELSWQKEGRPALRLQDREVINRPFGLIELIRGYLAALTFDSMAPPAPAPFDKSPSHPLPAESAKEVRGQRIEAAVTALLAAGQAARGLHGRVIPLLLDAELEVDELSSATLEALRPRLKGSGLLLVTSEDRSLEAPAAPLPSPVVALPPLNRRRLARLAEEVVGRGELTSSDLEALAQATGGGVGDALSALLFRRKDPTAPFAPRGPLRPLEQAAYERLPLEARELLRALSIFAHPFLLSQAESVGAARLEASEWTLERLLALGVREGVLKQKESDSLERFTFVSQRLRQHLLASLPEGQRQQLALTAAEHLEGQAALEGLLETEACATLFLASPHPERARAYLHRQLAQLNQALCLERAAVCLEDLIRTWPKEAPPVAELKARLAGLTYELSRPAQASRIFEEALAHPHLSASLRVLCLLGLGRALAPLQRYEEARGALEAALSSLADPKVKVPPGESLKGWHALAWLSLRTGRWEDAQRALQAALLARVPPESRLEVDQLRYEAWLLMETSPEEPALASRLEDGFSKAQTLRYREGQLAFLQIQAEYYQRRGQLEAARVPALEFVRLCRQAYDSSREAAGIANLGRLCQELSLDEEAITHYEEAAELNASLRYPLAESRNLLCAADLLLELGELPRASTLLARAGRLLTPLEVAKEGEKDGTTAWLALARARQKMREGHLEGLETTLVRARAELSACGRRELTLASVADQMELYLRMSPAEPARALDLLTSQGEGVRSVTHRVTWRRLHVLSGLAHRAMAEALAPESAQASGPLMTHWPPEEERVAQEPPHGHPRRTWRASSQGTEVRPVVELLLLQDCCRAVHEGEEALAAGLARLVGQHLQGRGLVWLKVGADLEVIQAHDFPLELADDVSRTVIRHVAETGQPTLLSDIRAHPRFGALRSLRASQAASLACWPVLHLGTCVGVLYVDRRASPTPLGPAVAPVLEHFASLAGDLLAVLIKRRAEPAAVPSFAGLVGEGPAMKDLRRAMGEIVRAGARTVFIGGETGTGKTLIARLLHEAGPRARHPFVQANLLGIPEGTVDSQLFGHRRGSFTGAVSDQVGFLEAASGGTVFIDEVGELAPALQLKLLKAIDEKQIIRLGETKPRDCDFHLITATRRNLLADVEEGRFREDLLYRIRANCLHVPPLRQRGPQDIEALLLYFVERLLPETGGAKSHLDTHFTAEALRLLLIGYSWPGNVRQLKQVLEEAQVANRLRDHHRVDVHLLEGILGRGPTGELELPPPGMTLRELNRFWKQLRQRYVTREIALHGGNVSETARKMGGIQLRSHVINIRDGTD